MAGVLKRVSSLKRTANVYHVPRRAEPDNAERPRGMVRCHVTLLDDTVFTCDIDKHSHGNVLLEEVFNHLDILEKDYFGVAYLDEGSTKWVDLNKQLKKQFKGSNTLSLYFRVKFYVTDPAKLQEELTRYQFYLQVKKDLATNKLSCSSDSIALLASYIVQAELGDCDPAKHGAGYVSSLRLVPRLTEELEEKISQLHQALYGKSTAESEYLFLNYARRLEFYGVELYQAKDHHGVELGLGITGTGISVFKGRIVITTFAWLHIQKITYKRKRFYIELRPDQAEMLQNVVGFHMDNYDGCKQLWKNCIEYHAFFRMSEVKAPLRRRRSFIGRSRLSVPRTEKQAMEANREAAIERSKSMRVKRRGVVRRSPQPSSGSEYSGGGPIRRTHSAKETLLRPLVQVRHNPDDRAASDEEGDYADNFSPGMAISDDMTGQFSLISVATDNEVNPLSLNYRLINNTASNTGPQEYYDERNAAEELAGQVCMDDLASEGLLLIRITADDSGRFGLNVRGGVDEKIPVIVTKVIPDSPAVVCNPPVEEGDQVLYINGKSVADRTHEQVIMMIKASQETTPSELVLIIKPRDLSRVNPMVRAQASPQAADPGHMLRESLTHLKETIATGKALLHFDRLYRRKPGTAAIASKLPQNLVKNRYRDISAYDATRVHLLEGPDYINANFVDMEIYTTGQINKYIAAQGPMQHTCKDFWQMVWEQSSTLLVMLTGVVEGGKVRCCRYWPDPHASQEWGKYEVHNVSEQADRIYITRNLKLRNRMTGEERAVVHMQYIDWPDHGIPGSKVDFLRFVQGVRTFREGMSAPVVVHCSAGIGRTGVFILMETALCKIEVLEPIYPLDVVRIMRDQRGMLVQTPIQYQFVCESVVKAYEDDYVDIELSSHTPTHAARPFQ